MRGEVGREENQKPAEGMGTRRDTIRWTTHFHRIPALAAARGGDAGDQEEATAAVRVERGSWIRNVLKEALENVLMSWTAP